MHTPTTGNTPAVCNCYDVSLWFISQIPGTTYQFLPQSTVHPIHFTLPVMETGLAIQGFHVLIGRDVLKGCEFFSDGKKNRFTLTYGP